MHSDEGFQLFSMTFRGFEVVLRACVRASVCVCFLCVFILLEVQMKRDHPLVDGRGNVVQAFKKILIDRSVREEPREDDLQWVAWLRTREPSRSFFNLFEMLLRAVKMPLIGFKERARGFLVLGNALTERRVAGVASTASNPLQVGLSGRGSHGFREVWWWAWPLWDTTPSEDTSGALKAMDLRLLAAFGPGEALLRHVRDHDHRQVVRFLALKVPWKAIESLRWTPHEFPMPTCALRSIDSVCVAKLDGTGVKAGEHICLWGPRFRPRMESLRPSDEAVEDTCHPPLHLFRRRL